MYNIVNVMQRKFGCI